MKHDKFIIKKETIFNLDKPRFNAHQTGCGGHKNKKKYTRKSKYREDLIDKDFM